MDGVSGIIKLKNKNRRTFMILRIIFNQNGRCYAGNHITNKNIVGCQLIIPMGRDTYMTLTNEVHYVPQRIAHASIIEEAKQCVNALATATIINKGVG